MSSIPNIAASASRRPTALVVEDDSFERLRLTAILERLGFEVLVAADGAEALAHLAACSPDVVVTDWQLPAVSGIDLCRTLQSAEPAQRPYTILVTARDEVQDLVAALDAGADDFLSKPYRAEELSARLRSGQRLLELRRALVERTGLLEQALRHQGRARLALDAELTAAARLQHQLLERAMTPIPALAAVHLFRPASQIGGDVFGTSLLSGGRVGFFHIDATGHGIAAALHAFAIATALLGLGGLAAEFEDPAAWVAGFNERALGIGADLGCSLVVGWLDPGSRNGRLCQAGHPHPLAVRRDGTLRRLGTGGLPVGALAGAKYSATDFQLGQDERLVLHSDGVTDCLNSAGQPFGQERLEAVLSSSAARELADSLRSIGLALDAWRGTATYDDDVSLLMLEPGAVA